MTVLVTGGAGYIGSHTVRALRAEGRDVVVLDDLSTGYREALPADVALVVGDIADTALVSRIVAEHGVDACIHFAAKKSVADSMQWPGRYFQVNTAGALELIEALQESGVRRFVLSSTAAVYGTPSVVPVTEDLPLSPESPYGESKLLVERMLRWFDVCHGFRSVSLRYFNAAGAAPDGSIGEDFAQVQNLVPLVMKAVLGKGPALELYGTDYPTPDGTAIRDYIHVDDLASAHVLAVEHLERDGASDILNLGTGIGSSVKEVISVTERITGKPVPRVERPRRPGDAVAVYADNARAEKVLGWSPTRTLDDIIESAWRWHRLHPDGFSA
ncbi:MAG: UDP-glucose 4-epimerase GalE [Acidimicrobiia bacterium]